MGHAAGGLDAAKEAALNGVQDGMSKQAVKKEESKEEDEPETDKYDEMSYSELQDEAKKAGIKATQSGDDLREALRE